MELIRDFKDDRAEDGLAIDTVSFVVFDVVGSITHVIKCYQEHAMYQWYDGGK